MRKSLIIIFFMSLLVLMSAFAYTLADYPSFFNKDGKFDVMILIPNSGVSNQFLFVKLALQDELNIPAFVTPAPNDTISLEQNLILVGNACENALVDKLKGFPDNCRQNLEKGQGRIELVQTEGGHFIIIIEGYDMMVLPELANLLREHKVNGTNFTYKSQNIPADYIAFLYLRKGRLNRLNVEGVNHTFKFIDVKDDRAVIEVDGQIQPERNDICDYDDRSSAIPEHIDYVEITLKSCTKPAPSEITEPIEEETAENQSSVGNAEAQDITKETQQQKTFFRKIIDWFLNLFK